MKFINKKKAEGGLRLVMFISVFLVVMGIIQTMFHVEIVEEDKTDQSMMEKFVKIVFLPAELIIDLLWSSMIKIPAIGPFLDMISKTYDLRYIHPYLAMLLTAIMVVPLGYLLLRLKQGGG